MPEPLRILEFRCADQAGGGPEKTILYGTQLMDPARYATTICYIRERDDPDFDVDERARELGLEFVSLPQRHALDLEVYRRAKQLVRERRIDLIHAHDYKTNLYALMLSRATGAVPLSTVHGYTGHSPRERYVLYPADRLVLTRFPRLIAVSTPLARQLVRWGCRADRVTTILNCIRPDDFERDPSSVAGAREHFGVPPGAFVLGSVGRVEPQKRFDFLLEAVERLLPKHPDLYLMVAGDGSLRSALTERAASRGLGDRCRFLGHCRDVRRFYHALDMFVQSSEYEGTPNVVLEAMAMEVPVVATEAGGTAELLPDGECGWIVPVRSPQRLAEAIDAAKSDAPERRRRVARARARVLSELCFETRTRRLEQIYDDLSERLHRRRA